MAIDAATVRKVAHLARIREPEERLAPLAQELNGILAWIEQLNEVDTEGVEPMTSAVAAPLPLREDVVTDGGDPDRILANAPEARRWLLRRAQGGGMSRAHRPHAEGRPRRPEGARLLVGRADPRPHRRDRAGRGRSTPSSWRPPERALADGARVGRAARRRRGAGRWKARRSGSRTCSAPRACAPRPARTSSASFTPAYESTVTANLWRDGAVMLGKLNMDEFAMGSSNETCAFGPVVNPWRARGSNQAADARRLVRRLGGRGGGRPLPGRDGDRHRRLDPPAGGLHRHGGDQADLRPLLALGHRRLRLARSTRPGRSPRRSRTRRSCSTR